MARTVSGTEAAEALGDVLDKFARSIGLEAIRRCQQKTPVDTGRARNNWNVSQDTPNYEEHRGASRSLGPSRAAALLVLKSVEFGDVIWISNGVPYIGVLEWGGPKRKAHAMAGLTARELRSWADGELRRLKRNM